jgi:transcriptional regulator with XRE-family HTH domain
VIHIGELIKSEVESQGLTQKEFGALINRNEKTVPNIYIRETISTDLLIAISVALNKDFLNFFYNEEALKKLREGEISNVNSKIQMLIEEKNQLQRELEVMKSLAEAQKVAISFATELKDIYKIKL